MKRKEELSFLFLYLYSMKKRLRNSCRIFIFGSLRYVVYCFSLYIFLTTVLSHNDWNFSHGKFGLLSPEKTGCDRVALANLRCMLGALVFP